MVDGVSCHLKITPTVYIAMANIDKFFKAKKINAIEQAFLRQCDLNSNEKGDTNKERESNEVTNDWIKQKSALEDNIKVLNHENKELKLKYEKLKSKHMTLLQVLLGMEAKNQSLEAKLQSVKVQDVFNESNFEKSTARSSDAKFEVEVWKELVNIILFLYIDVYSNEIFHVDCKFDL